MISLSEDQLAQGLHVALGALCIALPVCWGWHFAQAWGTGMGVISAAIKEFIVDILFETPETSGGWSGSWRDFSFYCLGLLLGNIAVIF